MILKTSDCNRQVHIKIEPSNHGGHPGNHGEELGSEKTPVGLDNWQVPGGQRMEVSHVEGGSRDQGGSKNPQGSQVRTGTEGKTGIGDGLQVERERERERGREISVCVHAHGYAHTCMCAHARGWVCMWRPFEAHDMYAKRGREVRVEGGGE